MVDVVAAAVAVADVSVGLAGTEKDLHQNHHTRKKKIDSLAHDFPESLK